MVGEKLEPDRLRERARSLILGNRKDEEIDDFQNCCSNKSLLHQDHDNVAETIKSLKIRYNNLYI